MARDDRETGETHRTPPTFEEDLRAVLGRCFTLLGRRRGARGAQETDHSTARARPGTPGRGGRPPSLYPYNDPGEAGADAIHGLAGLLSERERAPNEAIDKALLLVGNFVYSFFGKSFPERLVGHVAGRFLPGSPSGYRAARDALTKQYAALKPKRRKERQREGERLSVTLYAVGRFRTWSEEADAVLMEECPSEAAVQRLSEILKIGRSAVISILDRPSPPEPSAASRYPADLVETALRPICAGYPAAARAAAELVQIMADRGLDEEDVAGLLSALAQDSGDQEV